MWFSSPIHFAQPGPFTLTDGLLTLLWTLCFLGEIVADQQQWNFQSEKYRLLKDNDNDLQKLPERYRKGFITDGLFRYSRHPNFFCEINIWWIQFAFSVSSVGLNPSGIGALLLNLLFLGSTALTEKISTEKYPQYVNYQKRVSKLIPLPSNDDKSE
jgi:steroid 5-alpha reductase family enzyme